MVPGTRETSAGRHGKLPPPGRGKLPPPKCRRPAIIRQLLLMRHAKSSWDDRQLSDHARPLNARGRMAAVLMRKVMVDLGLRPDVVLVSSSRRTLQTLGALEPWDATPLIEPMDALYLAGADAMLAVLNDVAQTVRSVLLVAHNPGMHDLAMLLAGDGAASAGNPTTRRMAEGYPTGALAEFTVPGPWATLRPGGAQLVRFVAPRDLPGMTA